MDENKIIAIAKFRKMTPAIAARTVKLHDLKTKFGLQWVEDDQFF
jgi:hypothetical protein